MPVPLVLPSCGRGSCWRPHKSRLRRGTMTARATTSLSLRYHVKPGQNKEAFDEMKGMLDRCAKEPEFIMAIIHETPERPNEFVFYELWKGTPAESDGIQGPKPYGKAYLPNVRQFLEKAEVEWTSPILEGGTTRTVLTPSGGWGGL